MTRDRCIASLSPKTSVFSATWLLLSLVAGIFPSCPSAFVAVSAAPSATGGWVGNRPSADSAVEQAAQDLFQSWLQAYGLADGLHSPPPAVSLPPSVPFAPHLEECERRTEARREAERRGASGEDPDWLKGREGCCNNTPQPPWIRGSDASNLALTRVFQRDLWRRQFPSSCSNRRLLVTAWPCPRHGTGSMIHNMNAFLSVAIRHNRTLVVRPGSFHRANAAECRATGQLGQWECYFFPISSAECQQIGAEADRTKTAPKVAFNQWEESERVLSSDAMIVVNDDAQYHQDTQAASLWGNATFARPNTMELIGRMYTPEIRPPVSVGDSWWRAQTSRFLLRWPSALLCHTVNRVRHSTYGLAVAKRVVAAAEKQQSIVRALAGRQGSGSAAAAAAEAEYLSLLESRLSASSSSSSSEASTVPGNDSSTAPDGGNGAAVPAAASSDIDSSNSSSNSTTTSSSIEDIRKGTLAGTLWQMKGFGGSTDCSAGQKCPATVTSSCSSSSSTSPQPPLSTALTSSSSSSDSCEFSRLHDEPYMLRPFMSMHVRLSDKGSEMRLHYFGAFMFLAYKLREHVPNLEHIWLTTEMQAVVEETPNYPDWTFHYSDAGRISSPQEMQHLHQHDAQPTGVIFANLLITCQADYHLGALASNWNRLIDELRMTNGRLYAGYITMNHAWS